MSQSHNSTDSQALLQSMLQRLKLQPGREGLQTPVPTTAAPTWGQAGERGASDLQKVNNSPVNGFGTNGVRSKEFGIPAADSNLSLKGGGIQQVDGGLVSFPTQKDNTDGDTGENREPGITSTGTGQLFPAVSLKDADIPSSERTDGDKMGSVMTDNKNTVTNMGQNQNQNQDFTPKVYAWSMKPTDANLDTGSQEGKVLHVGNGGFGALAQSKDMQIVPANSSMRRKQRSSENKTRRWTQRIRERWRDRPGSFGKKGKEEEQREDQKSGQGTEISPQNQLLTAETLSDTSNKEEVRTMSSSDSSDPSKKPLTHTEDSTNEAFTRSTGDFEFGLGSFSLLDEIVTGQEWAKFLTPTTAAPANQRATEEPKIPPNPYGSSQSFLIGNHQGGVTNQWSFRGTETSAGPAVSMAQTSPGAFLPVSMDVTEGKQQQDVHRETDQSEPMEHGHTQSDMQSEDSGQGQQPRPPSFVKPADILKNSVLNSRLSLNRKRQHQSAERRDGRPQTEADREGFISSPSPASSHMMEETGESQHDNSMPSYSLNSPISPSSPPKGVLKHCISQDSESSMEVVTKRRRVEENRRVRFSEELVTIAPQELDLDASDSEEESGGEEDSVIVECEVEQAVIEEVAPARRPALPAWIRALKRKNTGRKHR